MAGVNVNSSRRRVPRRLFDTGVGCLIHGKYVMERSSQVGEGGMMITSQNELPLGTQLVASFFLGNGGLIMVRGVVRSISPAENGQPQRYGVEFLNLGFQFKREIRNFVAAATQEDGPLAL